MHHKRHFFCFFLNFFIFHFVLLKCDWLWANIGAVACEKVLNFFRHYYFDKSIVNNQTNGYSVKYFLCLSIRRTFSHLSGSCRADYLSQTLRWFRSFILIFNLKKLIKNFPIFFSTETMPNLHVQLLLLLSILAFLATLLAASPAAAVGGDGGIGAQRRSADCEF